MTAALSESAPLSTDSSVLVLFNDQNAASALEVPTIGGPGRREPRTATSLNILRSSPKVTIRTEAMSDHDRAIELRPPSPPQAEPLSGLALTSAIDQNRRAITDRLNDNPLPRQFFELGHHCFLSFERDGSMARLDDAIEKMLLAVKLTQSRDPHDRDLPSMLFWLAYFHHARFKERHDLADLDTAISNYGLAIQCVPNDGHSEYLPHIYGERGDALQTRFEWRGEVRDVDEAISSLNCADNLTAESFEESAEGRLDIQRPIVGSKLLMDIPRLLNNLGVSYQSRFVRTDQRNDLNSAILKFRHAIALTTEGSAHRPERLSNLGVSLQSRFELVSDDHDWKEAVMMFEDAIKLTPIDGPSLAEWFCNLGTCLRVGFERLGQADVDMPSIIGRAIEFHTEAVSLTPRSSPHHPRRLNQLAISYFARFRSDGLPADLDSAIDNHALATKRSSLRRPILHSAILNDYGMSLQARYESSDRTRIGDLRTAIGVFRDCSALAAGSVMSKLQAAIRLAHLLHTNRELITASDAYLQALQLLPQAAWIGNSVTHRHRILASQPATLAADAAACAIELGQYADAVELLDHGRSIYWTQVLDLRSDITDLFEANKELAEALERVGRELEPATFDDPLCERLHTGSVDLDDIAERHRRLAERWEFLIGKAREIDGFEDFLKPIPFSRLRHAASSGPVIILNVSKYHCDALIVKNDSPEPVLVPLKETSRQMLQELPEVVDEHFLASRGPRGGKFIGRPPVNSMKILWTTVVSPVIRKLCELFPLSGDGCKQRIWWYPTGPLTFLPIHAAGPRRTFVSSYTNTLAALIRARSLKLSSAPIRMLGVGVSEAPHLPTLPCVKEEMDAIRYHSSSHGIEFWNVQEQEATVTTVTAKLKGFNWIHIACHCSTSTSAPLDSALHLFNEPMRLSTIAASHLPVADFAFLSACSTATGSRYLPEESLHIAAGFQIAGFRSLIATLWPIIDDVSAKVADQVYALLFENGRDKLDSSEAAVALDTVVTTLGTTGSRATQQSLMPFIHIGV